VASSSLFIEKQNCGWQPIPNQRPVTLKASWQKQVLACSGYLELGMLDDAANALEEIQPDDKPRKEVLYAQVGLYVASKKWKMAAAVAGHLVKAEPENPGAWINLAYLVRRAVNVEEAETVLFKARDWHPKNALIAFNLACYASVAGRMEEAKVRLLHAIDLDKDIRWLALDDKDLRPLWDWIGGVTSDDLWEALVKHFLVARKQREL
jgi:tetratricopeptide (TPR) repeat protein